MPTYEVCVSDDEWECPEWPPPPLPPPPVPPSPPPAPPMLPGPWWIQERRALVKLGGGALFAFLAVIGMGALGAALAFRYVVRPGMDGDEVSVAAIKQRWEGDRTALRVALARWLVCAARLAGSASAAVDRWRGIRGVARAGFLRSVAPLHF